MTIHYTPSGPNDVVLDAEATARWQAGDREHIVEFAQQHADGTGHECVVYAANGIDVLYQVKPTPAAGKPSPAPGGVVGWVERNLQDPGDDSGET